MKYGLLLVGILLASCGKHQDQKLDLNNLKWVDLTYSFDSTTLYWPNNLTKFVHHTDSEGLTPLGYYYSSYSILHARARRNSFGCSYSLRTKQTFG